MIGRFVGTGLMRVITPARLLAAFSITNIVLMAVAIGSPGRLGLYALIASSFFMSIMFPTIFALGLRGPGESRKLASSILVMSIWSMAVPLLCFGVALRFATYTNTRHRQAGRIRKA